MVAVPLQSLLVYRSTLRHTASPGQPLPAAAGIFVPLSDVPIEPEPEHAIICAVAVKHAPSLKTASGTGAVGGHVVTSEAKPYHPLRRYADVRDINAMSNRTAGNCEKEHVVSGLSNRTAGNKNMCVSGVVQRKMCCGGKIFIYDASMVKG